MSIFERLKEGSTIGVILSDGRMFTGEFRCWIEEFGSIVIKEPGVYRQIDAFKIDLVWQLFWLPSSP
jgi:hypothetical protein